MIMTSFAPTSLWEIFPSGETRDRVIPGIFRVVAGGRTRGVEEPEFCLMGNLLAGLAIVPLSQIGKIPRILTPPCAGIARARCGQRRTNIQRKKNLHSGAAGSSRWGACYRRVAQSVANTLWGTHYSLV